MAVKQIAVSIVIPNYNGAHLLEKNIPRLLEVLKKSGEKRVKEIIIADDASTDHSLDTIHSLATQNEKFIPIISVGSKTNRGFSTNVNRGVARASGNIVVLLNTDVYPQDDFLTPALEHFSDDTVFAVGMLDHSIENGKTVKRGNGAAYWEKGFVYHRAGDVTSAHTFWVSGGSSLFRRSAWERFGGMDELYNPFYWEDIDLSYRAQKAGMRIVFEPESVVIHEHERGSIQSTFSKQDVTAISYRNQFIFVWKNITDVSLVLSHIMWLPYHVLHSSITGNRALLAGFFSALMRLPAVVAKRGQQKRLYKQSDRQILSSAS